jgi:hypothetical protein
MMVRCEFANADRQLPKGHPTLAGATPFEL